MNKLLSALAAGMLVLAMNGFAVAQNEPGMVPPNTQQETQQETQRDTQVPTDEGAVLSAKEQEYLVALTKCESLSASQKTKCIETAKKKFGQM